MKNTDYFNWLMTRSLKGLIYRNFFLYPKIKKFTDLPVADVGCGIGDFLKFYKDKVIGYDVNEDCINYCNSQNLNAILMKFNEIPAEDLKFNSVILDNVLEHIHNPIPLLNECHRVLNIKGKLIVGIPGEKGFLADIDHKVNYLDEDLINVVEKLGFRLETIFYTPFKSAFFNKYLSQYCRYFVFYKKV